MLCHGGNKCYRLSCEALLLQAEANRHLACGWVDSQDIIGVEPDRPEVWYASKNAIKGITIAGHVEQKAEAIW